MSSPVNLASQKYRVFVYGSLKQGFSNHRLLLDSEFLGESRTLSRKFNMVSMSSFPAVEKGGVYSIEGELYEVDGWTLSDLDALESNGYFYQRELVKLVDGSEAWMYVCLATPISIPGNPSVKTTRNHSQYWEQPVQKAFRWTESLELLIEFAEKSL